jgi:hypothetical protein
VLGSLTEGGREGRKEEGKMGGRFAAKFVLCSDGYPEISSSGSQLLNKIRQNLTDLWFFIEDRSLKIVTQWYGRTICSFVFVHHPFVCCS